MVKPLVEEVGRTPDGHAVHRVALEGGGLRARILTWGAVVQDLFIEGHEPSLVLGFPRFADYPAYSPYFGAIAGRYANRIRDGRFTLDGVTHQLDTNFLGKHHLHGGVRGVGKRIWQIEDHGADFIRLGIICRDGEMGYPGRCTISCIYRLADGALEVELQAETDAPTLVNLTHHSYFNLENGGAGDILDHRLQMSADTYTPVDEELIPVGRETVHDTVHDFRFQRLIWTNDGTGLPYAYDHNYCLSEDRTELRQVARVEAPSSGVSMDVLTTEPGLQFYSGGKLGGRPANGFHGQPYENFAGFALEPQIWPDSPNHPDWPQAVLRPGERYLHRMSYRFSKT